MNINANMKSVHSITGIPGSKKKRLPKNSGVFLLVSDSHTLGFPNPERLRRSEVCRMDIYHDFLLVINPFFQFSSSNQPNHLANVCTQHNDTL